MRELQSVSEFESLKNGTVVFDLYATWCQPCKQLANELMVVSTDIPIVKVDVEKFPEIASMYSVASVPTLLFLKNGQLVNRTAGFTTKGVIENYIKNM